MDPFSAEGELVNIHTAFIEGQYNKVVNDFESSSFSDANRLPVRIIQYRAQCALGEYKKVISSINDSEARSTPDLAAVKTYATFLSKDGKDSKSVSDAERLAETAGDNLTVQLLAGTVLARAEKQEQALQLLAQHQGSLDAVALIVQIHLQQNRTDLALKETKGARSFAQDALLVNLAESWIGMRQGGENYQKAFYVFEELAQGPSSSSASSLIAQAVSELHMARIEEAEAALGQALALEPDNATALTNKLVLDTIAGKDTSEDRAKLSSSDKNNALLEDISAKQEAFRAAMSKYTPKFEP